MPTRLALILLILIFSFMGALGLKLTELIVPSHADLGQTVTLRCLFDLGYGKLYSVKWYKDEFEFYRYMPDNSPQTQVFPLPGIHLDESSSDMNSVTLTQVSYRSSGAYRCEVSTEAPNFETVFRNGNMTVLAYPDGDPQITGVMTTYSVGDYITANCTSAKSNPPPRLAWFINGVKAESWLLDKHPILEHSGPLYSRSLGLRFQAEKRHFTSPGGQVLLKCSVTVSDLPAHSVIVTPRIASATSEQQLAQERYSNTGRTEGDRRLVVVGVVACAWWLLLPRVS